MAGMDREEIKKILPHRGTMLLIDRVAEVEPMKTIRAEYDVDPDWEVLRGHFPSEPVVPGVLCVECIAQAVDIMVLLSDACAGKTPLFAGIEQARFRRKVTPGDTAEIHAKITSVDEQRRLITAEGTLRVDGEVCCQATVTIAPR